MFLAHLYMCSVFLNNDYYEKNYNYNKKIHQNQTGVKNNRNIGR